MQFQFENKNDKDGVGFRGFVIFECGCDIKANY